MHDERCTFCQVVGRTETRLAAAFSVARDCAPTILFLDHIESLGAKRGYHTSTEQVGIAATVVCLSYVASDRYKIEDYVVHDDQIIINDQN